MTRASSIVCCVLLATIVAARPIEAAAKARPATRRVELILVRRVEMDGMQRLEAALRDSLLARNVSLASERKDTITPEDVALATTATPGEAASIVARVFVDFTAAGRATLFLIDPRRGRIHVRRVMLDHGLDAVARESTLFVIEQSVDAILEGREIGVSREEYQRSLAVPAPEPPVPSPAVSPPPPPPPPPPAPPPPPSAGRTTSIAGGYAGVALGAGTYQHAGMLVLAAQLPGLQISVAARIAAPFSITGDGVEARLVSGGVSVSAAATLLSCRSLTLRAGIGAGLDVTRVAPATTTPDLQAAAVLWAAGPSLRAIVEIERRFGRLCVSIALGAEGHLLDERYTVRSGDFARDVFVPYRVRPVASALAGTVF